MDIGKEKQNVRIDIKRNFKTFSCFFLVNAITTICGSFLYIYIEHCCDVQSTTKTSIEIKYETLCHNLQLANLTTAQYIKNETAMTIQSLCADAPVEEKEKVGCEFDLKNVLKWARFSLSVGFTIGYGRVVPFSDAGKIITIFYALLLIPLTAATMVYCSNLCVGIMKMAILVMEKRALGRHKIFHFDRKTMVFQSLLLFVVLNIYVFHSRNLIVDSDDNPTNSYVDAYYFAVITMTTIGFGDYDYSHKFYEDDYESFGKSFLHFIHDMTFILLLAMGATFINAIAALQLNPPQLCKKDIKIRRTQVQPIHNPTFNQDGVD